MGDARGHTSGMGSHPGKDVLVEGQGQQNATNNTLNILGRPCMGLRPWAACSVSDICRDIVDGSPPTAALAHLRVMHASDSHECLTWFP